MRILHALQELTGGGAESMAAQLVTGAQRAGFDVAVAGTRGCAAPAFRAAIFDLPIIGRAPIRLLHAARALRSAVRAWRPDILHCHNPAMALAAAVATGPGRRPRKLVTVHGISDADYATAARMLRWLALETVACGPGVAEQLRAHGLDARLIANGCPAAPAALDRGALEAQFPGLRGRALVVGVGRLMAVKNFQVLVRAAAALPDAIIVIAGEGPERDALLDAAIRAGARDRVFLPGYRSDARALIGTADAVVIGSRSEGLPLVAIEAMMAGTPLVAARAAWQTGFLTAGRDCLLVPFDDAQATAAAIARLLGDRALATRLRESGRSKSVAYAADATVAQYLDLYRTLASADS